MAAIDVDSNGVSMNIHPADQSLSQPSCCSRGHSNPNMTDDTTTNNSINQLFRLYSLAPNTSSANNDQINKSSDHRNLTIDELKSSHELSQQLVDIFWLRWLTITDSKTQVNHHSETSVFNDKQSLLQLIKKCLNEKVVTEHQCKITLPEECLDQLSLINQQVLRRQTVRLRTAELYKQEKFNLLREESEGFSKLITELLEFCVQVRAVSNIAQNQSPQSVQSRVMQLTQKIKHKINALIGYFELDPNRVVGQSNEH